MSPRLSLCKETNKRDDDGDERKDGTERINRRQETVPKRHKEKRQGQEAVEDQQDLPRLQREIRVVQRGRGDEEGGEAKVDGQGDGPVADDPDPARHVGDDGAGARRGDLVGPVVGAGGRGVLGGEFAEGDGDAFVDDEDHDPADEHGELAWGRCC